MWKEKKRLFTANCTSDGHFRVRWESRRGHKATHVELKADIDILWHWIVDLALQAEHLVESLQTQGAAAKPELAVLVVRGLAQQRSCSCLETDLLHQAQALALAAAAEALGPLGVKRGVAAEEAVDQDEVSLVDCVVFVFGHLKRGIPFWPSVLVVLVRT